MTRSGSAAASRCLTALDANGNWKASLILTGLGLAYALFIALPVVYAGVERQPDEVVPVFLPGAVLVVLGGILMYIHRTIVGRIIGYDESRAAANGGNDEHRDDLDG